jgi:predicted outer membrane repeat protein
MRIKIPSKIKCVATAVALLCAGAILARANTITVTNRNDSGPGSLRQALAIANDGDTINFSVTGTITLTTGELTVNNSITISGPGADNLAINGNATSRVFYIASGRTVTISGLMVTNGNAVFDYAGGIYNDHSSLTVTACRITANSADIGGGMYSNGSVGNAAVTLNSCTFSGNLASQGGGIFNDGSSGNATVTLNNSTFSDNSTAYDGGGIYSTGDAGSATVTVNNSTFSNNSAGNMGGAFGGGISSNGPAATVTINNSTFSGNSASEAGGGVENFSIGNGGGATLTVSNSTFSGNSSVVSGGGIYNYANGSAASVTLSNSTFSGNSADSGGASFYNDGSTASVQLTNTILKAGAGGNIFNNDGGTITSHGYNLASDNGGGFLTGPGDQINTDPVLGPLQDNGGPTFTHALLPGSPAIDHGDPNFTPPPFDDQRGQGYLRVVNGRIDIGAFEVQTNPALFLLNAVSRKTHGGAGTFDINLPLSGEPGVECRSGGGNYTEVFTFTNNVVSGSAAVTGGTGNVSGSPTFSGHTMTVNLTGVIDVQTITVTLTNVTDEFSHVLPPRSVSMGVLIGDVNGNRTVNASDVALTKSQVGQAVGNGNFREDVNASGTITATDVAIVKSDVGHALPP